MGRDSCFPTHGTITLSLCPDLKSLKVPVLKSFLYSGHNLKLFPSLFFALREQLNYPAPPPPLLFLPEAPMKVKLKEIFYS